MVSRKNYEKNWLKIFFRSESFSIRTYKGRAPASELVLLRGGLPSEIALQGGSLESRIVYRRVGADFEKPKKLFSAHNEQGIIKRGEKWSNIFFRSESFSISTYKGGAPASELVLLRGGLRFEIALQGGSLESKFVYRGVGADFEKPKKKIRLTMNRVA